jgi:hypothetical protein
MPFWIAAAGGLLLAFASLESVTAAEVAGAVLFLLGTTLFFTFAVRRARADGTGMATHCEAELARLCASPDS